MEDTGINSKIAIRIEPNFMFSHCFTGILTVHPDLLPQTTFCHLCLSSALPLGILDYIFQLSVRFFMIWLACKLAISVFLHQLQGHLSPSSSGHPPDILGLWNSSISSMVRVICIWRVLGLSGYESLNDNLRLVLLTRGSK
jgi:hypothetical protein